MTGMDTSGIEVVLRPIQVALEADGYALEVTFDESTVSIGIVAGPEACEECLSPPSILEPIVRKLMDDAGWQQMVELRYPAAWSGNMG